MARFLMPVKFLASPPKMHLRAHDAWRRAYERGLVSEDEWRRYEALIETHPLSWKGWLKVAGRGQGGRMEASDER